MSWGDYISAAGSGPLSFLAFLIVIVYFISTKWFSDESLLVRVAVFSAIFVSVLLVGYLVLVVQQDFTFKAKEAESDKNQKSDDSIKSSDANSMNGGKNKNPIQKTPSSPSGNDNSKAEDSINQKSGKNSNTPLVTSYVFRPKGFSERLCVLGFSSFCNSAGQDSYIYDSDMNRAKSLFIYGCDANNSESCNALGLSYLGKKNIASNSDAFEAYKAFRKGCDLKNGIACVNRILIAQRFYERNLTSFFKISEKDKILLNKLKLNIKSKYCNNEIKDGHYIGKWTIMRIYEKSSICIKWNITNFEKFW